jgi:hypothetical protein
MKSERGENMALKVVGGAVGAIAIVVLILIVPDLKRYMRMRSM